MTHSADQPTAGVALKPKFGDLVENGWASEGNPTRRGFFVREFRRTGRLNPGLTWEITDGKGKFWEFKPSVIAEGGRLTVTPAALSAPAPSTEALAKAVTAFVQAGGANPAMGHFRFSFWSLDKLAAAYDLAVSALRTTPTNGGDDGR